MLWEYNDETGIILGRQAIDQDVVTALLEECDLLLERGVGYTLTTGYQSPRAVETVYCRGANLAQAPAITHVVGQLLGAYSLGNAKVGINRQLSYAYQEFHADGKRNPVAVVHLSDQGAFDYTTVGVSACPAIEVGGDDGGLPKTVYVPNDFDTIEVNAGDILVQSQALVHRGRNLGERARLNFGIYTV